MDFLAGRVRCVENQRTGAKAWIFYQLRGELRCYLSSSKLSQMLDVRAAHSLMKMKARENRRFPIAVRLYCVKGRKKGQWLVHRFADASGIEGEVTQKGLGI